MTYKLVVSSLGFAPILVMLLPLLSAITSAVLDGLTRGHTLLTVLLTWCATDSVRAIIRVSAPSKASGDDAVARTAFGLPALLFIACLAIIRLIVVPLESVFGLRDILTWSPSISVSLAARLAMIFFLLGLSVVFRFIGQPSIGKCIMCPSFGVKVQFSHSNRKLQCAAPLHLC